MTTKFTASDGRAIEAAPDGMLLIAEPSGHVSRGVRREHTQALREYFETERDRELDRWRDPAAPHMVVYRLGPDVIRVMDEREGRRWDWARDDCHLPKTSQVRQTATRYFAAHPEPRPWSDAQPGDVWLITLDPGNTFAAIYSAAGAFFTEDGRVQEDDITHAERIWPGADDE